MSNWREYKLVDLVDNSRGISYGIVQPGTFQKTGGVPVLKVNNLVDGKCTIDDVDKVSTEVESKYARTRLKGDELLISLVGSLGHVFRVTKKQIGWNVVRAIGVLPIRAEFNRDWVYYVLKSPIVQNELIQRAMHTVQATLNLKELKEIAIPIPDYSRQTTIAEILSCLDEKIELNSQINRNLEGFAQALFKQWFIDFEFSNENGQAYRSSGGEMVESELGMIPKGWEVRKLSSLVRITGGGTPKRVNEEYWNGDINWFSVQDVPSESQVVVIHTLEKITELGLNNSSTKILPIGTTIITARGTVGKLAFVASPMAMNQSCYGLNGIEGVGPFFNYYNIKQAVTRLQQNTHGAVFDTITTTTFDTVSVAFPGSEFTSLFDAAVSQIFKSIENNVRESEYLSMLRDSLLPKLISGELEVS